MFSNAVFQSILFGLIPFLLGFTLLLALMLYCVWLEARDTRRRLYLHAKRDSAPTLDAPMALTKKEPSP